MTRYYPGLLRLSLVLAILAPAWLAQPAQACGCGGFINDGNAIVSQESVLIRWDGQTEQLLMSLGVLGTTPEAALVLPVPAQATVTLGNAAVWGELDTLTRPLIVHEKRYVSPFELFGNEGSAAGGGPPTAGAGAPPVTVLSQQTLGPFEVTNLAATDATALEDWLTQNGYTLSPGLAQAFAPYIEQGWFYIAVKLTPGSGDGLSGDLDPLQVTFPSEKLVYPMRGSANASGSELVTLYILADHRVEKTENFGDSHTGFADWVEPTALQSGSALTPFVNQKLFLTKFAETVNPEQVNDDFWFSNATDDTPTHDTITVYDDDYTLVYLSMAALCLVILLPVVGLAGLAFFFLRRRAKTS